MPDHNDLAVTIRPLGQSAALVSFASNIDPSINQAVYWIGKRIAHELTDLIEFLIPAYCSIAIGFDRRRTSYHSIEKCLNQELGRIPQVFEFDDQRKVEIPVCYCRECGPDLAYVAQAAGLSRDEVIERHVGPIYRAYMLGFLPGFAYLGRVDDLIACVRRDTPRATVPAGSVGLAGPQTGVYPCQSPGGWQLIGRTSRPLLRNDVDQPFLIGPGDAVCFRAVDHASMEQGLIDTGKPIPNLSVDRQCGQRRISNQLEFLRSGMHTTIQDFGRSEGRQSGVPAAGAMDRIAATNANRRLNKPDDDPVLEITLMGPDIRFESACQIVLTGARFDSQLDGQPADLSQVTEVSAGSVLHVGRATEGCRGYLAVTGRLEAGTWLGSASAIAVGDLDWNPEAKPGPGRLLTVYESATVTSKPMLPYPRPGTKLTISVLPGPELDWLPDSQQYDFTRTTFSLSSLANRMGYRLTESVGRTANRELISSPVVPGTVQLPPDGRPVVLMRDAPTTGGYPRIAVVTEHDINRLAQLKPGDRIRFRWAT